MRLSDGSRMSGDVQVRFCESVGVRLPHATLLVVMARYVGERITNWVENKIETWMGLVINRDKTKVMEVKQSGKPLDFLGYSFRYDKDLCGRNCRYWN